MRAKELFEGRDAPLYHGTSYENAKAILTSNLLKAQPLPEGDDWDTRDMPVISLSRSIQFVKDFIQRRIKGKGVVFEVDQTKLAQRYKIKPWNYYANAELSKSARVSSNTTGIHNEYEEFITRDITDFDSYLVAIHAFDPNVPAWLKKHPKLTMHVKAIKKTKPKYLSNLAERKVIADQIRCPVDEVFAVKQIKDGYLCILADVDDPSQYEVGVWHKNQWNPVRKADDFNQATNAFRIQAANMLLKAAT